MLNVAVHDLCHMNVFYSNGELYEDLLCLLLREIFLATSFCVVSQVPSRFVLGDEVDLIIKFEVVDYSQHVIAVLTAILGLDF